MSGEVKLVINGQRVAVDRSFLDLSAEDQNATVDEIAASLGKEDKSGNMGQLNQGIAESGGLILDILNPFDKPHALNPFKDGTGSAVTGLEKGMDAIGVNRATSEPDTFMENVFRGAGNAAGAAPFGGLAAKGLSQASGMVGQIADDAATAMASKSGVAAELAAGGAAQGAESLAEDAGAPEWLQLTAGIVGGAGAGAVAPVVRATPTAMGARKVASAVKTAALPYTNAGGEEVARQRIQELAGGADRAAELAKQIGPTEIGLTPAQQIGDKNLLALEQEAMKRDPKLRAAMDDQAEDGQHIAANKVRDMGGDPADAQAFFEQRRQSFREEIIGAVDRATKGALRPTAKNSDLVNSQEVSNQIKAAETAAKAQEDVLWARVPKGTEVGTSGAKAAAQDLIAATPRAQQDDIPRVVRQMLAQDANDPLGEFDTVAEVHGLYSELRRVARSAMAGSDQNPNKARIANKIADSILDDLGSGAGQTEVGRSIDTARAFSAEMHQTFSQGIVGKLLRRTPDGDMVIDPALTLDRSLGRGGTTGAVAADNIQNATSARAEPQLEDFLRSRFDRAAFAADDTFNPRGAATFMRDNADMMERFPYLKETFDEALRTQTRAAAAETRGKTALKNIENPAKSVTAAFNQAPPEAAIDAIFKSKRPSKQAKQLVATARKDKSGKALAGLRGSFADFVIRKNTDANGLSGDAMIRFMKMPENEAALKSVLNESEFNRLGRIAVELKKLRKGRKSSADIGGLSPRSPNRVIEMVARVIAAKQGAKAGGGSSGASIQTAQMASGRMKALLGNLQNDKAEQMLIDAVSDPQLFHMLMVKPESLKLTKRHTNKLAPYFTGTGAALATSGPEDGEPDDREGLQ